jgi:hypothetical protein
MAAARGAAAAHKQVEAVLLVHKPRFALAASVAVYMRKARWPLWQIAACASLWCLAASCVEPSIQLIGLTAFDGDARDAVSVEPLRMQNGAPQNRVGGVGSAIDYTGTAARYVSVPDRPGSQLSYYMRFYLFDLRFAADMAPRSQLAMTQLLRDEAGRPLIGNAASEPLRFDPESVRVSGRGTFYVAEEYAPSVVEFDASGRWLRRLRVPQKFLAEADASVGRQPKSGFEGLALSPDGDHVFALLQRPLQQDHALGANGQAHGVFCRLLEIDLRSGKTRELVYTLESHKHGTNELLALNDHELLVIERDWEGAAHHGFKRVFVIDIRDATDVSELSRLPARRLPSAVRPVAKRPLLDLQSKTFDLTHDVCMSKIESLAFAPDLPDGRHVLVVGCDNDFDPRVPSEFAAFAIRRSALDYRPLLLRPTLHASLLDGRLHLSVLSTPLLDAAAIDRASITLCRDAGPCQTRASDWSAADVNGDGLLDLTGTLEAPVQIGAELVLSARTTTGHPVRARASLAAQPGA